MNGLTKPMAQSFPPDNILPNNYQPIPQAQPQGYNTLSNTLNVYDDNSTQSPALQKAGVRQTSLSSQLQQNQKKKARPKTAAIGMYPPVNPDQPQKLANASLYSVPSVNGSSGSFYSQDNDSNGGFAPPSKKRFTMAQPRSNRGSNVSVYSHNSGVSYNQPHQQQYQDPNQYQQQHQQQYYAQQQQPQGHYPPQPPQQLYQPAQLRHSPQLRNSPKLNPQQYHQQQRPPPLQFQSSGSIIGSPGIRRTSTLGLSPVTNSNHYQLDHDEQAKNSARLSINSALSFIGLSPKKKASDQLHTPDSLDDDRNESDIDFVDGIDEGDDEKFVFKSLSPAKTKTSDRNTSVLENVELTGLKSENEQLKQRILQLESQRTNETREKINISNKLSLLEGENEKLRSLSSKSSNEISGLTAEVEQYKSITDKLSTMETDYSSLLDSYELSLQNNESLVEEMKLMDDKLTDSNLLIVNLFCKLVTELPSYLSKESYLELFDKIQLPPQLQSSFNKSLESEFSQPISPPTTVSDSSNGSIPTETVTKEVSGTGEQLIHSITAQSMPNSGIISSDQQIFSLFREEVKSLSAKIIKLEQSKLQIEKNLKRQIMNERSTIKQLSVHRSFSEPYHPGMNGSNHYNTNINNDNNNNDLNGGQFGVSAKYNAEVGNLNGRSRSGSSSLHSYDTSINGGANGGPPRMKMNRNGGSLKFLDVIEPKFSIIRDD